MSVSRDEVLRIAHLSEIDIDDEALPDLANQLSRILEYVAQLNALHGNEQSRPFIAGPDVVRFRPDEVKPVPLAVPLAELAPSFKDGFFVVPRLGQFDDAQPDAEQ
jgi:aspartyl-tRNA(Asn)/glutamyl-tRNA(Gln) amidotransferase subunit C